MSDIFNKQQEAETAWERQSERERESEWKK